MREEKQRPQPRRRTRREVQAELAVQKIETPASDSNSVIPISPSSSPWRRLFRLLRAPLTRSHLLVGVLCLLLGFALVAQVRAQSSDPLARLRQEDLVRLLDEVEQQTDRATSEQSELRGELSKLRDSESAQKAASEAAARDRAAAEVFSGTVPAQGPGLVLTITDPADQLSTAAAVNLLGELRNAGAEVIEVNKVRLGTTSWISKAKGGLVIDTTRLQPPYQWRVIGDGHTLETALGIPGGALATIRNTGAQVSVQAVPHLEINSVRQPRQTG